MDNKPPSLAILKKHRKAIISLAKHYGAENLRVFGSVARGEAHADSDIDLLVDFFKEHSLLDRIALMQDLSDLLSFKVDIVQEKMLKPHIRPQVLKDAISL